jgi:hypothetical protein
VINPADFKSAASANFAIPATAPYFTVFVPLVSICRHDILIAAGLWRFDIIGKQALMVHKIFLAVLLALLAMSSSVIACGTSKTSPAVLSGAASAASTVREFYSLQSAGQFTAASALLSAAEMNKIQSRGGLELAWKTDAGLASYRYDKGTSRQQILADEVALVEMSFPAAAAGNLNKKVVFHTLIWDNNTWKIGVPEAALMVKLLPQPCEIMKSFWFVLDNARYTEAETYLSPQSFANVQSDSGMELLARGYPLYGRDIENVEISGLTCVQWDKVTVTYTLVFSSGETFTENGTLIQNAPGKWLIGG